MTFEKDGYRQYFKVVHVNLKSNECELLKGPEEEKRLLKILWDDYNSTRYDKWVQLVAREMVRDDYVDVFLKMFSAENIRKEFQSGKEILESRYVRKVDGIHKEVKVKVYPGYDLENNLEEFMIYVKV